MMIILTDKCLTLSKLNIQYLHSIHINSVIPTVNVVFVLAHFANPPSS